MNFEPGESVIFVNANNVAVFATFVEYGSAENFNEGRVCVEWNVGASDAFRAWPHLERVGRIGPQVTRKMAEAARAVGV